MIDPINHNLSKELKEVCKSFSHWLYLWSALSFSLFVFNFQQAKIRNLQICYPVPSSNSISVQFLKKAQRELLPETVQVVTLNPINAFLAVSIISLTLAFILSFPFFLYKLIGYLKPALYQKERKAAYKILIPSVFLFIAGCLFAYFLLLPITFQLLYSFAMQVGAASFFHINQFVTLVLVLTAVGGIVFLLPIFMILLTRFGIVKRQFWKGKWKSALFTFLAFSAIITPDGTGIPMLLLFAPLAGFYFLGMVLAKDK